VVLAETLWTLKGKKYRLNKAAMIDVLYSLFEESNIYFEDGQTVWRALNDYRQAKPVKVGNKKKEADFPDAMIVNKAMFYATEKGEALNGVYTFDLAAQLIPGTAAP
jgi:predicted nucleic-acid-binding protein